MAFKHGVYSIRGESLGEVAVSSATCLLAIGSSKSGSAGKMAVCHSVAEFHENFGDGSGAEDYEACTLEQVAKYGFEIARLSEIVFLTCGDDISDIGAVFAEIKNVYKTLHKRVNLICAPGVAEVSGAVPLLIAGLKDIVGVESFDAMAFVNLKHQNGISEYISGKSAASKSENLAYYVGKFVDGDSKEIETSVVAACEQVLVDARNQDVPFEVASNRTVNAPGEIDVVYSRDEANQLNAVGINCICYLDGVRLWGGYLSTFDSESGTDGAEVFISSIRMINNRRDMFLRRNAVRIDKPLTRQVIDQIIQSEQQELDRLVAIGALIGSPKISFEAVDNPTSQMISGSFVWNMQITPTVPFASGTLVVRWTDAGFSSLVEG